MINDERHTFYHHHGCVETQSLWLINAYLADKSIDTHQQILLTIVRTLGVINAVNDNKAEIARNVILAQRGVRTGNIHLSAGHKVFNHLSQIEAHPRFYAETYCMVTL